MTSPEEHGEEIGNNDEREIVDRIIFEQFEPEMHGTDAADLATKLVALPVTPDGGRVGRTLAPRVGKADGLRDMVRVWSPGITASVAFFVCASVFPLTTPLVCYGLALVGFGWWHSAGRPGTLSILRMLTHPIAVIVRFAAQLVLVILGHADDAIRRVIRRATARRVGFETHRTSRPSKK